MDIPGKINGLSLFSGIGGIDLALKEWIRPIAYCEIDLYCQGVLLSRISDGSLPNAPIWDDITTLSYDGRNWPGIDIIYGGFPCQDISIAGNGRGLEGERSGLFYEIIRLSNEIRPRFIFLENVPAITTRGGLEVVKEITKMGYDSRWITITASSVGALHKRERWFLLAHSKHNGTSTSEDRRSTRECPSPGKESELSTESVGETERTSCISSDVASNDGNADSQSSKQTDTSILTDESKQDSWGRPPRFYWPFESREHWQETVSSMGKCSHGISNHVDRLRGLGNAVVPQQTKEAFKILMGMK